MKTLFCLSLLFMGQLSLSAAETAYTALRVVGKQNGSDALNRVLEVRGRNGSPEPQSWRITLADSGARGGLREMEVRGSRVVSEKAPVSRDHGRPINFSQLNLDSEGAFTVANQEAQKVNLTFERVDYTLQGGARSPVWHLELYAGRNAVGSIDISADNGAVVRRDLNRRSGPPADDREYTREDRRETSRGEPPPDEYRDDYREDHRYVEEREYRGSGRSFPDRVLNHFEKRGNQIKRFFTGRD